MSRERWQRIESLFEGALELSAEERERWLDRTCDDAELRREVSQMLIAHERAAGVLEREPQIGPQATPSWREAVRPSDPFAQTDAQDPGGEALVMNVVGPYRVERELGRGGMGIVYLARDSRLDRPVALKLLARHLGSDPDAQARFRAEARAASALDHPSICTIYDIGRTDDGREYIAMAFYDGDTLAARIEQGPLEIETVLRIGLGIAEGLAAAHDARVVHRDIKPSNVMITRRGETKILDFGVAKLESSAGVTNPGVPIGTVAYMSPEQARGESQVGPPADLWALGVLIYETLEGRRPFTGDHLPAILHAIVSSAPPSLTRADLPVALPPLILDLLQKDPARRPDARTLIQRLRRELNISANPAASRPGDALNPHSPASASSEAFSAESPSARSFQVPEMLTRFFGRERELEASHALLHSSRLLTLTGPAGTGKTRLSLEIAASMSGHFPDGMFFVPLASIDDPSLVPSEIARVLMPEAMLPVDPLESVRQLLANRAVLLILDNFEQVVAAAPVVSSILIACPGVKVLATSRVVLRVSGEHAFAVPPLALIDPQSVETPEDLRSFAATALFLDRAQSADPSFQADRSSARAIAAICERLDGIPLAIELAAARIRSFPPEELLARLARRLDLLRGGGRDRPSRHQTLRQAIGWSYALLAPSRQRLFCWLSVFSGGFTMEAAEEIGAAASSAPRAAAPLPNDAGTSRATPTPASLDADSEEAADVVEAVSDLFDHSLLRRDSGQARFGMLETIREFALDRLTESGELSAALARHSSWMIALAEEAARAFTGPDQKEWFDRCDAELDNLRAASSRAVEQGDPETGLRIAGGIWRFWLARGHLGEGRNQLEQLLGLEPRDRVPASVRADALHGVATLCHNQGFNWIARQWLEEELRIWRELGDRRGIADTLNNLGWVACEVTELEIATSLSREALELGRELKEDRTIAVALNNLGWVANYQADHAAAIALHGENLALRRRLGDRRGIAFALGNLAWAHDMRGEYEVALGLVAEANALLRDLEDDLLQGFAKSVEGRTEYSRGELTVARDALETSAELWERVDNPSGLAWALIQLARVQIDLGEVGVAEGCLTKASDSVQRVQDHSGKSRWYAAHAYLQIALERLDEAAASARESLALSLQIGDRLGIAESSESLALISAKSNTGDPAWLLAAAQAIRDAHELPSAWASLRTRERVLSHLRERKVFPPVLTLEAVTAESLRHQAALVGRS